MSCTFRRKGGPKSRSQRGLQNAGWVRGLEPPTPRSTIDSKTSPKSLRFPGFCGILLSSAAFASLCEQTPVFPRNSGSRGSESGSLPAGPFAPEGKTKAASLSQPARRSTTPPDAPFVLTASDASDLDPTHETAALGPLGAWGDAGETGPEDSGSADSAGAVACGESSLRYTRPELCKDCTSCGLRGSVARDGEPGAPGGRRRRRGDWARGVGGVGTMGTGRASPRANLSRATAPGSERGGQAPGKSPCCKNRPCVPVGVSKLNRGGGWRANRRFLHRVGSAIRGDSRRNVHCKPWSLVGGRLGERLELGDEEDGGTVSHQARQLVLRQRGYGPVPRQTQPNR